VLSNHARPEENAVPAITADHPFVRKHAHAVSGVLSCFDRVIFRGYLPLSYARGLEGFLAHHDLLLKDFKTFAPQVAERLKAHVRGLVEAAGAPFRHLPKKERMEDEARRLAQARGQRAGIVCGFSKLETCATFRLQFAQGRPRLKRDYRRCTVLYVFVMHAALGLIHVKLETWFPLTMQVYVNGHEFLARKLDAAGLGYQQVDNTFSHLDDAAAAQALADRFCKQNWPKLLGDLARQFNPLLGDLLQGQDYYWVTDQAEYATDVLFDSAASLQALYPRLVEHAALCLGAEDLLKFLGRKLHPSFLGEVHTEVSRRPEGTRVKHTVQGNRLKMYDKAGRVLRLETVINRPRSFRVRRWRTTPQGRRELVWQALPKGVAWLWRYAEISRAANSRYLEALAVVDDWRGARQLLDQATRPARLGARRKRALQPLSPQDQALFLAVLRGEHRLRGVSNAEVAARLFGPAPRDVAERRRRCARVTRLLQVLRAHGLLAKIPRTRRYRVTAKGEALMSAAVYIRYKYLPQELHEAG
jgi:hypothetical protein